MPFELFRNSKNSHPQTSFEKQFSNREKIKVAGGVADTIDIRPEEITTKTPVFFAPSWGCTMNVYGPAFETLVKQKRRVISLDHPRIGGSMKDAPLDALATYPKEELRKALNILGVLDQKKIEKVDAISHSEGSINLIIAATLQPEKFRNIVLYAPAGLIGDDTIGRLAEGHKKAGVRAPSLMPLIPPNPTEKKVGDTSV